MISCIFVQPRTTREQRPRERKRPTNVGRVDVLHHELPPVPQCLLDGTPEGEPVVVNESCVDPCFHVCSELMVQTLAADELVLGPESVGSHDASHHSSDGSPNLVETEPFLLYHVPVNLTGEFAGIILVLLSIVVVKNSVAILVGAVFLPACQAVEDELVQCGFWFFVGERWGTTTYGWRWPWTDYSSGVCLVVAGLQGW